VGGIETQMILPLQRKLEASIASVQTSLDSSSTATRTYVATVHSEVAKSQGDTKYHLSWAIELAVNVTKAQNSFDKSIPDLPLEHEELKRCLDTQQAQIHEVQDLVKKKSKSHSQILKQFGSKD
jgi:hypothetical protein